MDDEKLQKAADILSQCETVVVSTGAGVSRESGIPTFRENQSGIWANFNPEELATLEGFLKNPKLVWEWYQSRIEIIKKVDPNPGHYAIAKMQDLFKNFILITQNIDNLHQKAGSRNVCELHGNILQHKCLKENTIFTELPETEDIPPLCPSCHSMIRPNVVWFGEALPEEELTYAFTVTAACDCIIVVGTSGLVQPAASLPFIALKHNARIIEVNPNESAITPITDVFLKGKSGEVLPELVKLLEQSGLKKSD